MTMEASWHLWMPSPLQASGKNRSFDGDDDDNDDNDDDKSQDKEDDSSAPTPEDDNRNNDSDHDSSIEDQGFGLYDDRDPNKPQAPRPDDIDKWPVTSLTLTNS